MTYLNNTFNLIDLCYTRLIHQVDEKDKEIHRLEEELKERPTMEEVEETIRSATCQEENLVSLLCLPGLPSLTKYIWFLLEF